MCIKIHGHSCPTQPKASTFTQHSILFSLSYTSLIKEMKMFNMPPHLKFCWLNLNISPVFTELLVSHITKVFKGAFSHFFLLFCAETRTPRSVSQAAGIKAAFPAALANKHVISGQGAGLPLQQRTWRNKITAAPAVFLQRGARAAGGTPQRKGQRGEVAGRRGRKRDRPRKSPQRLGGGE